jgi:nicotinate phosphoribosyltransferase
MPEGTVFFPDEPLLRVTAPLPEAQFVETRLMNLLHFQTVIASKAARMVLAAPGKQLVDFGFRRAHGAEAGLLAARASYLAGFSGTATVAASRDFGIPCVGTMAHSFIQAHVAGLAPRLAARGIAIGAVRLDSGDLAAHARAVRAILDAAGQQAIRIFASGGLDEDRLLSLCRDGVPIDGFGIGTSLTTASDAPALDCAYKLQQYAGLPRRKRSEGKATWPGAKQVYRHHDDAGRIARDIVALIDEPAEGEALLWPVMRAGRRVEGLPTLTTARSHAAAQLALLPEPLRRLEPGHVPVQISPGIRRLSSQMDLAARHRS